MNKDGKVIQSMFSGIAKRYDLLNKLLSAGIDKSWRIKATSHLPKISGAKILDIACGTCDLSLEVLNRLKKDVKVFGVDFSLPMLRVGYGKIKKRQMLKDIKIQLADAHEIPYKDNSFDGVTIAFGLRNLYDRKKGISEMIRVVKKGGKVVILEFTTPDNFFFKKLYYLYFRNILPLIGGIISGDSFAYKYLPDSVVEFPSKERLKAIMEDAGLKYVKYQVLTFGIAAIHVGEV